MIFVFYFFAIALLFLSTRSFIGGVRYARFFKTEHSKTPVDYTPYVTVIAPCRGLDAGLEENLRAVAQQDYPLCEIIFVVDDKADPAVKVIRQISGETANSTKIVVAQKAIGSSQKVANLREAVLHAADRSEAFVFVDSDIRPSRGWLRHLVAPLRSSNVGAATGYRWYISNHRTFASEMRSVWNASVASALGPNTGSNFCWGGSTAIRRDVFNTLGIREKWSGTLSDDFTVTRALNEAGLSIVFVPQALAPCIEDCSFGSLIEFTTRQMKITRVYVPGLWLMSLIGSGVFTAVIVAAVFITIFGSGCAFFASATTLTLVTGLSVGKAWMRLNAVKLVLPEYRTKLDHQFWPQITLWILAPAIFFYNSLAAWLSRRITWRGTTYELKSPTETVIITD